MYFACLRCAAWMVLVMKSRIPKPTSGHRGRSFSCVYNLVEFGLDRSLSSNLAKRAAFAANTRLQPSISCVLPGCRFSLVLKFHAGIGFASILNEFLKNQL